MGLLQRMNYTKQLEEERKKEAGKGIKGNKVQTTEARRRFSTFYSIFI